MFCQIYNYSNFDLTSLSAGSIEMIVWGICIGVIIGVLCALVHKSIIASFIKVLVKNKILTAEDAKTLDELKLRGKWYLRSALKYPYKPLRRYVMCANEEELTSAEKEDYEKKLPMDKALFYLPEENRIGAETRYSEVKKPIFSFIFTTAIIIAAAFFLMYAVPELLQMLDNFITSVK